MEIKIYRKLPQEAKKIRTAVFIEEQKFVNEFDEIDALSRHLVVFDENIPVATCRFYISCEGAHVIGRIAVIKEYRKRDIGSLLLKSAEAEIIKEGGKQALVHSQCAAAKFYEKNGFTQCSEVDFDESCPHVWMVKQLSK